MSKWIQKPRIVEDNDPDAEKKLSDKYQDRQRKRDAWLEKHGLKMKYRKAEIAGCDTCTTLVKYYRRMYERFDLLRLSPLEDGFFQRMKALKEPIAASETCPNRLVNGTRIDYRLPRCGYPDCKGTKCKKCIELQTGLKAKRRLIHKHNTTILQISLQIKQLVGEIQDVEYEKKQERKRKNIEAHQKMVAENKEKKKASEEKVRANDDSLVGVEFTPEEIENNDRLYYHRAVSGRILIIKRRIGPTPLLETGC